MHQIPMANVIQVYPGIDGVARVVKVYAGKKKIKRAVQRLFFFYLLMILLPTPPCFIAGNMFNHRLERIVLMGIKKRIRNEKATEQ